MRPSFEKDLRMERSQIFSCVCQSILSINESLTREDISESSSLTQDLGLDSFRLELLIAKLKEELLDTEYTPWYVRASRRGQDTVCGLIDFIHERR